MGPQNGGRYSKVVVTLGLIVFEKLVIKECSCYGVRNEFKTIFTNNKIYQYQLKTYQLN